MPLLGQAVGGCPSELVQEAPGRKSQLGLTSLI